MPTDDSAVVSCPHAVQMGGECPGCAHVGTPYGEQLAEKRAHVAGVMAAFPELVTVDVQAAEGAAPITGYRTRSKLVVEGRRVGLFAAGSHRVVDIPECRVMDPAIRVVAERVRRELPLPVPVSAVDLRRTGEGVLATLVVPESAPGESVRAAAERVASASPDLAGVAVSRKNARSVQLLGRAPETVIGRDRARVWVTEDAPYHLAAPGSFTQAHAGQQRAIQSRIVEVVGALGGHGSVLELFAGSGALSLALASGGASCTAVEAYGPAVLLAEAAAREQSLALHALANDATSAAESFAREGRTFDVVIVNPPRRGLHPDLRALLPRLASRACVYVSCEPVTLSRDLADLARRGLVASEVVPYDMIPLTRQVETFVILRHAEPPLPVVLHEDAELIAVAKPPHLPTTPQGEHDRSLLRGVQRLPDAESAVPVHRLDVGTSGVCLFARRPDAVLPLAAALKDGQKEYIALAKGVTRPKGSVSRPIVEQNKPQEARTRYTRREVVSGHSLVSVRPDQGRKHQIRRHLQSIGHAVVGDDRYGDGPTAQYFALRHFLDRPFLHCARIVLERDGRSVEISAPLAPDLGFVLASMRAGEDTEE